jgi:hypothetical protein
MMLGPGAAVCEQAVSNHPAKITDTKPVKDFRHFLLLRIFSSVFDAF